MRIRSIVSAIALTLGSSLAVHADDTSSSIRGQITTPTGEPAVNTKIVVTHIPTGSTRTFQTNAQGAFNARGLRVGGPYKVFIDSDDYNDEELTDVYLELGNPFILNESLEAIEGETVVITASAADFRYPNSGSNSVFGSRAIEGSPSTNRDIKDVLKRNPLVNVLDNDENAMSIAGSNPRYNSITVDGVRQDDDFGLNGSGYPTQRSSISIDAIEQVSITHNPFNAKESGFSGAGINIVTKSGTNEFKGSVFYEYNDDKFAGPSIDPNVDVYDDDDIYLGHTTELVPTAFTERTYGFSVGGPVIEDELFFYFNYEKYEESKSILAGPSDYPSGNRADVSSADALEVIRIAQDVYGVNAGTWEQAPEEFDTKMLLKLDWDISDFQRLSFTYQNTDGELTANTIGGDTLNLSSHFYTRGDEMTTYSIQLFSDWSDAFSTKFRIASKDVDNTQNPFLGTSFGQVEVRTASGDVEFGPDRNRHANQLSNDNFQVKFEGEYLSGDHTFAFGTVYDKTDVFNIFVRDSLGSWTFNSLADFENREASRLNYSNAFTNNARDGAAEFDFENYHFYLNDTWDVNEDFTLTYGIRYELYKTNDQPAFNQNFEDRYGFANNATLDGKSLVMPRVGFNWQATEDLRIHGGFGKFGGGKPNVWLSNAYTNDGLTIVTPDLGNIANSDDYLTNVDITQVPQIVQDQMFAGDGNSTPISPNFKLPYDWRYSIGFDLVTDLGGFGEDWNISGEYIYKDVAYDVRWIDLSRRLAGRTVEGRPIYGPVDPSNENRYDLMLSNSEGGSSNIVTFTMAKEFDNGLDFSLAYTHQNIEDKVPGTSSTAESNYQFTTVLDRQNPGLGTAAYEVEHRLKLNIDYDVEFFSGYETTFGLFAERVSGRPFSWTLGSFRDDDFGDQDSFDDSDVYLPYIPTGPNDPAVEFDCGGCLDYEEIMAHLRANGIQTTGGYLERNAYKSPWKTNIDLYISQELPGFTDDQKGELYFTIDNFLNLIDKSSGKIYSNRFGENQQILFDYDINSDGQYRLRQPFGGYNYGSPAGFREIESAWRVKIGVKYNF